MHGELPCFARIIAQRNAAHHNSRLYTVLTNLHGRDAHIRSGWVISLFDYYLFSRYHNDSILSAASDRLTSY